MQGCIVTSRFSDVSENREGRLSSREGVIGLLNARLVHPEKLCQEPVLCCSCPLNPVGQATSRSKGSRRQCAWVWGTKNPLHRTMIGGPTKYSSGRPRSAGLPSNRSIAGATKRNAADGGTF